MQKIFPFIRHFIRRYFLWILIVLALALLAGTFEAGRYSVYRAHPELSGVEQANEVLKKVGSLIQLPSGETPTMATINDAKSAKQAQPFLANALNGDVLIVYPNAQEALLYRPSTNKLIAVGPVNNSSGAQNVALPQSESTTASSTPSTSSGQANDATSTKSKR